ncbi:hypothetical protein [Fictibacillus nanhaiensis]|uniref:hypothetical protein n=1 Tax=Fictibacillus nanhaiensis TaxID=742169 RepID=UPI001FE74901|nr:hypothetical protein [Fictibacillus nanhaiensis]
MDKVLKEMKDDFENYLNPNRVFSEQEKRRILNHVRHQNDNDSKKMYVPKIISSFTLVSLCALIVFLVLNFTDAGEKSQPANLHKEKTVVKQDPVKKEPVKTLPKYSDKEILDKAIFLQSHIAIGMVEKEVIDLFGTDYKELDSSDSESGASKIIGYNMLVHDSSFTYKFSDSVDFESLLRRDISIQFFIGFTNEGKMIWANINYPQGKDIYTTSLNSSGKTTEKYNPETNSTEKIKEERNPYAAFPPTLTTEEKAILEKLKEDLNENHLRNLSPISIAKIYVEANLQRRNDVVYALYTDQKDLIRWTKDEDENIPDSDRGSTEQIIKQFNNLENGKFIQTNNNEGYIEFLVSPDADAKSGFKMVKDEDGIWNVAFMPIQ